MALDQVLRNRESETKPLARTLPGSGAPKRRKYVAEILGAEPRARVLDFDRDVVFVVAHSKLDSTTGRGMGESILEQVVQDLDEPLGIDVQLVSSLG